MLGVALDDGFTKGAIDLKSAMLSGAKITSQDCNRWMTLRCDTAARLFP